MKILYMTTGSYLAGTEKNVLILAKFMKKKGHDVYIFTLTGNDELINEGKKYNVKGKNFNLKKYNFFWLIKIKKILKKEQFDIIHSFLFHTNIISRLAKPKNTKLINSFRSEDLWKKWYHYFLGRITQKKVDIFTINFSKWHDFKKRNGLKKDLIYIPNGTAIKNKTLFSMEPFTVKLIGRFHPVKQHIPLVKAISMNKNKLLDIHFEFIGRGPLKDKIAQLIQDLNLEKMIKMRDFIYDEEKLYEKTSIVISVSKYEGFPNTLLEANSYGIPVISFDIGAASDIINDGFNGYIVNDFKTLLKKIIQLKENEKLIKRLSKNSIENVKEKFELNKILAQYEQLYNDLYSGEK